MNKFFLWLKASHARPIFDTAEMEPGGYLDSDTLTGNLRSYVLGLFIIYSGRYFDLWLRFQDLLFRDPPPLPSPWRMQYHSRIAYAIGIISVVSSIVLVAKCMRSKREELAHSEAEAAAVPPEAGSRNVEQRLRDLIARIPVLHDLIWGWPFLLGVSLVFFGKTADGSAVPGLSGIFVPPSLDFFVLGKTPVSALNGMFVGSIAYAINHAISKTGRLHLAVKSAISVAVGALAIWAWYALTVAMGAPI